MLRCSANYLYLIENWNVLPQLTDHSIDRASSAKRWVLSPAWVQLPQCSAWDSNSDYTANSCWINLFWKNQLYCFSNCHTLYIPCNMLAIVLEFLWTFWHNTGEWKWCNLHISKKSLADPISTTNSCGSFTRSVYTDVTRLSVGSPPGAVNQSYDQIVSRLALFQVASGRLFR